MSEMTARQNSNLKGIAWVVYSLSFLLLCTLLFFAFIFSQGRELFGHDAFAADVIGGYWYLAADVLSIACFFSSYFVKSNARRTLIATVFTIGIILTAIIGPTYIAGSTIGPSWLSFYTPIPWFIVWVAVVMMWLFTTSQRKPSLSDSKSRKISPKK
jgi:hypothetical protein